MGFLTGISHSSECDVNRNFGFLLSWKTHSLHRLLQAKHRDKRKRKRDTTDREKENIEANKESTSVLFNKSQLITVFTRAGYNLVLHFTKLHLIYITVILILSSQLLLCLLSVLLIQIYPLHPVSSVHAKFYTISASAVSPKRRSSCCCKVTRLHCFLLLRYKYPSQLIIL